MARQVWGWAAAVTLVWVCLPAFAQAATNLDAPSAPRFAEADLAFRERADPARAREAVDLYESVYAADPADIEAGWRLSMALYYYGRRVAPDKPSREVAFARGRDLAKEGVSRDGDCAPCHLMAGVHMALYGESVGVFKMLFSLGDVRRHLRRAFELDPAFAYAAAPRTLAMIDEALPGILGGSKDRAQAYYEQAILVDPSEPLNYLFYAGFLEKRRKDPRAALAVAQQGLQVERPGPHRVESIDALNDLQQLVARLELLIAAPQKQKKRVGPGARRHRVR